MKLGFPRWAARWLVCSIALWLFLAGPALAQTPADDAAVEQVTDAGKQEARAHFRRAVELFQDGAYRAALIEFERAYASAPNYRLLYNIAQTRMQVHEYIAAMQAFEQYLVDGADGVTAERREEVNGELTRLRERVGQLAISTNRDQAEVFVDDAAVGQSPLASTVPVNVGRHRVSVRSDDGTTAAQVVDVAGGELVEVSLTLPDRPAPAAVVAAPVVPTPAASGRTGTQNAAIAGFAVTGVLAVGGGIFAALSLSAFDDFESALDEAPGNATRIADARDKAETRALLTDVMLGGAAAVGITSLVLWFVGGSGETPAETAWQLHVGPRSAAVEGRF